VLEKTTSVTNGQVTIGFVRQVENPKINAIEVVPVPTSGPIRVNAGGPSYTDTSGNTWTADVGYNTGSVSTTTTTVTGTTEPTLYQTSRYPLPSDPPLTYTLAAPNGNCLVRLHFAETYSGAMAIGKRVFDIDVQSARAFEDVDIFARVGGNKALVLEKATSVTNGQVKIGFVRQVENPKINAIEIIPSTTTTDTQPPTAPGTLTFNGVTSTGVTVNWTAATDNVGVTSYRISRGSTVLSTVTGLSYIDTGLTANTSYTYSVVALDAAGNASPVRSGTISTTGGGTTTGGVRVNAGGPAFVDTAGNSWAADTGYNTGSVATTTTSVTGTTNPTLYKTSRYPLPSDPPLTYTLSVPNGNYVVRLHFAETYAGTMAVGKRVFDIDVQSARAFEDVDIFARVGGNKALILEQAATVTNGQMKISFIRQVENPKINAIEVIPATVVRINAGGPIYAGAGGNTWSADTGYNTGVVTTSSAVVTGTPDPTLFKTERYESSTNPPLVYSIPVANGKYMVRLYFAETYSATQGPAKRVFDIDIEAVQAFDNVDIYSLAGGGNKALVLEKVTTVSDGQLTIGFVRQTQNPKINALEIFSTP
jgi:chitodextrinase